MSEYQYYEFRAIDRRLDRATQNAFAIDLVTGADYCHELHQPLRMGQLKGDPGKFMERWFDLHLYLANWGTRRLMIRVPKGVREADGHRSLSSRDRLGRGVDLGDNLIIDIHHHEDGGYDDWDDGSGRLAALAPLRTDLLSGDLRLFYLLWLKAVQYERRC